MCTVQQGWEWDTHPQIPLIISQCNPGISMTIMVWTQPQKSPPLVRPKRSYHQWMLLSEVAHPERLIARVIYQSAMPVTWRLNGLSRMNLGFTSRSEHCQVARGSSDESDSGTLAGKLIAGQCPLAVHRYIKFKTISHITDKATLTIRILNYTNLWVMFCLILSDILFP